MNKKEISTIQHDIKSFKRVRRVVGELITSFPEDAFETWQQEEFLQLSNARIFLDKTIIRLQTMLDKIK